MTPPALTVVDAHIYPPHFPGPTYFGGTLEPCRISLKVPPITYLIEQPQPNSWFLGIRDEIRGYLELAPNWDSYGGGPISNVVVGVAERFAELMAIIGFSRPNICPEPSGGILLEWQSLTQVLTVDIESDDIHRIYFSYESAETPELDGEGNLDELVRGGFLHDPF